MRVVLTGPPGAGKSTIISGLAAAGITVVPEAATDIIAELQADGCDEPWKATNFTELIAERQRQRQQEVADAPLAVFDRSPICTLALARYLGHAAGPMLRRELSRIEQDSIYSRTAFYIQPLGHIVSTAARRIGYAEAVDFGELHRRVYTECGHQLLEVPTGAPAQRVGFVYRCLRHAAAIAGG